jgi:D-sedoheptulose 7-phosphate isomerase
VSDTARTYIRDYLSRSVRALDAAVREPQFEDAVARIADAILRALGGGGKLLLAGNGGSAADAQHLAGELLSRFRTDRAPLAAIALTTDTSVLTAIGNDYGYQYVFERQVRGLGRPPDVFLGISTSGRSPNVLLALRAARDLGLTTVGFTGAGGGEMADLCDLCLAAPSDETPIIQQIHIIAGHMICGLVEQAWIADRR